jgi:hypothetical protein
LAACTTTGGYANHGELTVPGEKEYWLAGAVNPLIGTWSYLGGGIAGMTAHENCSYYRFRRDFFIPGFSSKRPRLFTLGRKNA